ncbi:MAG TPA: TIGR04283 family arsenosugar biosynthesis glycosyltransferase, partial [Thermodesulfobacteriota bacterium]
VDGGSADATVEVARRAGATVLAAPRGRGRQLAAGADAATGDVLLFCHADCRLPAGWATAVRAALAAGRDVVGGAFRLGIASPRPSLAIVAASANVRSRLTGHPYGDQALFVRAEAYRAVGGFAPLPLMEDIDLCRRLWRVGRLVQLDLAVRVSARRWEREGTLYATLRNAVLAGLFYLGVDPARLARWYRPEPATPGRAVRCRLLP